MGKYTRKDSKPTKRNGKAPSRKRLGLVEDYGPALLPPPPVMGRPTKYNPDIHPQMVIDCMGQGMSMVETSAEMEVDYLTFYRWSKDDHKPEFCNAVKIGTKICEAWWERQGRLNIRNKDFNSTLWMMNMGNRFRWVRSVDVRQKIEAPDKPIEHNHTHHQQVNDEPTASAILGILAEAGALQTGTAQGDNSTLN